MFYTIYSREFNMKRIHLFIYCVLVLMFYAAGCSDKEDKVTLNGAWSAYSGKHYQTALKEFKKLILTEDSMQAYCGAGWSSLRLGWLDPANQYFIHTSSMDNDAVAGWAFTYWGLNQPTEALNKADFALFMDPAYVFDKDTRIDYKDLIWIQASSYLQLQNYTSCLDKIKLLDTAYTANVSDPNIAQILFLKLQSLGSATGL
jgi:hypothetical protein